MKTLHSLQALVIELEKNTLGALVGAEIGLHAAAKIIQKDAKHRIGTYQDAEAGFNAWKELAESTKEDRARKGFSENDPLLRSGDLRESIVTEFDGLTAIVGSKMDIAMWQEGGTSKIPPRPFIGPAAFGNKEKIVSAVGGAAVSYLVGKKITRSFAKS